MPEAIMTVKNGNAKMSVYDFPCFEDYRPNWLDIDGQVRWHKMTPTEKEQHYNKKCNRHNKRIAVAVKKFMKETKK